MTLTGYYLGRSIPGIERHIEYVIAGVVFLSLLPLVVKYLQHRREKQATGKDAA
jgi:membrane protein DedA with SNARE-associated domain